MNQTKYRRLMVVAFDMGGEQAPMMAAFRAGEASHVVDCYTDSEGVKEMLTQFGASMSAMRPEQEKIMSLNTCDACKHYTPSYFPSHMPEYKDCGECALTDLPWPDGTSNWQVAEDKLASWDVGDAGSGIYVGPKFGCIHWESKR